MRKALRKSDGVSLDDIGARMAGKNALARNLSWQIASVGRCTKKARRDYVVPGLKIPDELWTLLVRPLRPSDVDAKPQGRVRRSPSMTGPLSLVQELKRHQEKLRQASGLFTKDVV